MLNSFFNQRNNVVLTFWKSRKFTLGIFLQIVDFTPAVPVGNGQLDENSEYSQEDEDTDDVSLSTNYTLIL